MLWIKKFSDLHNTTEFMGKYCVQCWDMSATKLTKLHVVWLWSFPARANIRAAEICIVIRCSGTINDYVVKLTARLYTY